MSDWYSDDASDSVSYNAQEASDSETNVRRSDGEFGSESDVFSETDKEASRYCPRDDCNAQLDEFDCCTNPDCGYSGAAESPILGPSLLDELRDTLAADLEDDDGTLYEAQEQANAFVHERAVAMAEHHEVTRVVVNDFNVSTQNIYRLGQAGKKYKRDLAALEEAHSDASIVFIQEVEKPDSADVADFVAQMQAKRPTYRFLATEESTGKHRRSAKSADFFAFFVDTAKFRVLKAPAFIDTTTVGEDKTFRYVPAAMLLEPTHDATPFHVWCISVHLFPDKSGVAERLDEARAIGSWICTVKSSYPTLWIIAGDFNVHDVVGNVGREMARIHGAISESSGLQFYVRNRGGLKTNSKVASSAKQYDHALVAMPKMAHNATVQQRRFIVKDRSSATTRRSIYRYRGEYSDHEACGFGFECVVASTNRGDDVQSYVETLSAAAVGRLLRPGGDDDDDNDDDDELQ